MTTGKPRIGGRIVRLEATPSTIDEARRLAREGAEHGMVVLAERQTAGRGRRGRSWTTLPGRSLAGTVILREQPEPAHAALAGMAAALAVVAAAAETLGVPLRTKWPNDVVSGGRKVAGTLAEVAGDALLLSIGLNVGGRESDLPPDLRGTATTLEMIAGRPVDRDVVIAAVLSALDGLWSVLLQDPADLLRRWDEVDVTRGAALTVTESERRFGGVGLGVDAHGQLLVRLADGRTATFAAGDVTLQPQPLA